MWLSLITREVQTESTRGTCVHHTSAYVSILSIRQHTSSKYKQSRLTAPVCIIRLLLGVLFSTEQMSTQRLEGVLRCSVSIIEIQKKRITSHGLPDTPVCQNLSGTSSLVPTRIEPCSWNDHIVCCVGALSYPPRLSANYPDLGTWVFILFFPLFLYYFFPSGLV